MSAERKCWRSAAVNLIQPPRPHGQDNVDVVKTCPCRSHACYLPPFCRIHAEGFHDCESRQHRRRTLLQLCAAVETAREAITAHRD